MRVDGMISAESFGIRCYLEHFNIVWETRHLTIDEKISEKFLDQWVSLKFVNTQERTQQIVPVRLRTLQLLHYRSKGRSATSFQTTGRIGNTLKKIYEHE